MSPEEWDQLRAAAVTWCGRDGSMSKCGDELAYWLDMHQPTPSIPLDEVKATFAVSERSWGDCMSQLDELIRKYEPKPALPPNPHQQGTYLWAREEAAARGRDVGRERYGATYRTLFRPGGPLWDSCRWTHADFIATDWEVVT